jgi:hypothetical protein
MTLILPQTAETQPSDVTERRPRHLLIAACADVARGGNGSLIQSRWASILSMDADDRIWNRAAMQGGGDKPAAGDRALADALSFHSLAMNGGVLDAVERSDNLTAVEDGFRWLGLDRIAELLASVRHAIDAGAAYGHCPSAGALGQVR